MVRYNVHLKEGQIDKLTKLSNEKEEPISRLIREAIDLYLDKHTK